MEPITGLPPPGVATPLRARGQARASGFSVPEQAAPAAAADAAEMDTVSEISLAGLLALQEEAGGGGRDRAARRRGLDLLAELAALQRDLLGGALEPERLERLAELAEQVPSAADPRLRDAVAAITLRARIEVARYGTR
jgi:hypothetical protein